jgi:hypothetical protein
LSLSFKFLSFVDAKATALRHRLPEPLADDLDGDLRRRSPDRLANFVGRVGQTDGLLGTLEQSRFSARLAWMPENGPTEIEMKEQQF